MNRRGLLFATAAACAAPRLWAGHGWAPFGLHQPLYLEGPVTTIIWSDPHPHLELLHGTRALPPDLQVRRIPPQREAVDLAAMLSRARLPPPDAGRTWRVELPTLARLSVWEMPRPKIEQVIGVLGHRGPDVTGTPTVQAEVLFLGDRAYPLRSDPA